MSLLADGTELQDAISGENYTVTGGNIPITLAGLRGAVLLPSPVNVDLVKPRVRPRLELPQTLTPP